MCVRLVLLGVLARGLCEESGLVGVPLTVNGENATIYYNVTPGALNPVVQELCTKVGYVASSSECDELRAHIEENALVSAMIAVPITGSDGTTLANVYYDPQPGADNEHVIVELCVFLGHSAQSKKCSDVRTRLEDYARIKGANSAAGFWCEDGENAACASRARAALFDSVYRTGYWSQPACLSNDVACTAVAQRRDGGSASSGAGSTRTAARGAVAALLDVVNDFGVRSILDIGCGDQTWLREVEFGVDLR